mmetsp:Transcript_15666/g.33083  ORF Transcript_15666/g.33083 Transcript_15666/m.33083 type:complete len:293 (+) Transcript_15666:183-1061(+)|eukprot:CAMPEP_0183737870 /NCGR_PEP_ID=MMETSP0737-20130205/53219_1 /TAXON_ID=385413 /ORGANISM="Thalassiosira miniscula, Strain CCMP1093" /LENGTH=292 /DNA_ID=CAMNT_0025972269 /DNA_START=159 /DNA_END=1037 /DNA_ORIENTATION=-
MIDNCSNINDRLDAMRAQEETTRCFNYFTRNSACGDDINEACRRAMVTWLSQVQKTLSLSPESVWIAMSFFDRYLSSGKGKSQEALKSKRYFQLAAITAFYTAIKIYEPVVLGIDMLIEICRGSYKKYEVIEMEKDILSALDWRVACHTPMEFATYLLELLPKQYHSDELLEMCQEHIDFALTDIYFSCCKPSVIAISALASSLTESCRLSLSEKQTFWLTLSELCSFDLAQTEVIATQQRLLSNSSKSKQDCTSKVTALTQTNSTVYTYSSDTGSPSYSSPILVTQTARQA